MTGAGPPKCKTCNKAEWGHVCDGSWHAAVDRALDGGVEVVRLNDWFEDRGCVDDSSSDGFEASGSVAGESGTFEAPSIPSSLEAPKPEPVLPKRGPGRPKKVEDRKAYLKVKARERRAKKGKKA